MAFGTFVMLETHGLYLILEHLHHSKRKSWMVTIFTPNHPPQTSPEETNGESPVVTPHLLSVSTHLPLLRTFHLNGIAHVLRFSWVWLPSFSITLSRVIHDVACISTAFRFMAE